jgi:AcrR family transcriptional regulator
MANQSQKKFDRLMEKSKELFWKYGYNGVSVDQIAKEAGISKMTIYKHFSSKEDLFIQVLMGYAIYHTNKTMEIIEGKYHTFDKIESLYTVSIELSNQMPAILTKDIMERPHVMNKLMAFKEEKSLSIWRYILEDGIKKGEIRPLDVDFVSHLLWHIPKVFVDNKDYYTDEIKRGKLFKNLFDFLKYGLLGSEKSLQHYGERESAVDSK